MKLSTKKLAEMLLIDSHCDQNDLKMILEKIIKQQKTTAL